MATERPPIVVVVGHIDHGKTTLLDSIRKTKIAAGESGGITQHIGAYEITERGKKITFIDTPGHEAFSKMRSRGAAAADIGILVVAADDGVKPQTKEAIAILKDAAIPYLVAINKIDRPGADPNRVKRELAEEGVLTEAWGGKVPVVEISAKQGTNLEGLLELILLLAEVEELTATDGPASGIVIESHRDPLRGNTATLLIRDGHLEKGNSLAIGGALETFRILENFLGSPIDSASASMPIRISGLSELPEVGEEFRSFESKKDAEAHATASQKEAPKRGARFTLSEEDTTPTLFLILKADVSGSREALEGMLEKLKAPDGRLIILKSEVGDVNEGDVKAAAVSTRVIIAAFKVRVPQTLRELAERQGTKIAESDIIYDLCDAIKKEFIGILPPKIVRSDIGRARILAIFKRDAVRQIVGGRVVSGKIVRGAVCDIERQKKAVGQGKVRDLQHGKKAAPEVREGLEFGVLIESSVEIMEGDELAFFTEETVHQTI